MVWYIIHAVVTLLWDSIRLSGMSVDDKTIEVLVLRQQLLIMRWHQKHGPSISQGEKFILLTLLEPIFRFGHSQKARLEQLALIFRPDTLLRWHRDLVRKKWTVANTPKAPGRPPTDPQLVALILRLARENQWGDNKIEGELKKLGYRISHETIRQILRSHGVLPVPIRKSTIKRRCSPATSSAWKPSHSRHCLSCSSLKSAPDAYTSRERHRIHQSTG